MEVEFTNHGFDGGLLYSLLVRHNLLPTTLNDPNVCILAASRMSIGFLHDGKPTPLAVMLESYPEPGVVGLMFITEVARLNQRRDELIEASLLLRNRWFNELNAVRVECRVPIERTQTIRCLKHMGFKIETLPRGLRNTTFMSGVAKSLCVLGLLPDDPIHKLSRELTEPIITEGVEHESVSASK